MTMKLERVVLCELKAIFSNRLIIIIDLDSSPLKVCRDWRFFIRDILARELGLRGLRY